jgi:hypothetical protein
MDISRRAVLGGCVAAVAGCLGGDNSGADGGGNRTVVNATFGRDISEWTFNASEGDTIRIQSDATLGTDGYGLSMRDPRDPRGDRLFRETPELSGDWNITAPATAEYELHASTFGGRARVAVTVIDANS